MFLTQKSQIARNLRQRLPLRLVETVKACDLILSRHIRTSLHRHDILIMNKFFIFLFITPPRTAVQK